MNPELVPPATGPLIVGHPHEIKRAVRALALNVALRATRGQTKRFTISRRHPMNSVAVQAKHTGRIVYDVWNSTKDGGGPPDGICYGCIVVDQEAWLEGGKPITISEWDEGHAQVLLKQGARA